MSVMIHKKLNWKKRPCAAFGFLLSWGLSQAFAQSTPTPTPAALSWAQFRLNPQNTSNYQPFDLPNFQTKWQFSLGNPRVSYSSPPVVLDLGTNNTPDGPPIGIIPPETTSNTGMVFIGTTQGKLVALRSLDGGFLWSYQTQGEIYSSPAVLRQGINSRIFAGSTDGMLRAFDISGNVIWKFQTGDAIFSSPTEGMVQGTDDDVIVGSNDGTLYCLPVAPASSQHAST